jgi:acetylornithine deacetylase/succinyl-diaminopimelate desuccinylase-like protein
MPSNLDDIYAYIDSHRDEYVSHLIKLLRQPSIAAQNEGMAETARMVAELIGAVGGQAQILPTAGHPVVYGEVKSSGPRSLLLYNHYDVQPADPLEQWNYPPFEATIADGRIWARGVSDNKGNLVARLCAVDAWLAVRGELPLTVKCVFEGEEEIGSPNLEAFAEEHHALFAADGCIWEAGYKDLQGRLQISLGCKGITYVELRAHGANRDLHSSNAAIVPSPVWRLMWALATLKDQDERILIDGFYDDVLGPSDADRELLAKWDFQPDEFRQSLEIDGFLRGAQGEQVKEDFLFQPTCNICGIQAGYTGPGSKTVLPNYAFCKIDFRLVPNQRNRRVLELLRNHLDRHGFEDIEVVDLTGEDPARTDPNDPLVGAVVEAAEAVYSQPVQVMPTMAGTGPMYHLCQRWGIPAVGSGVGHADSRNHAPNESIFIEDYIEGIKHIATIFDSFSRV